MGTTVDEARVELTALFEQWLERIPGGDDDFFGRMLDDDWVYADIAGAVRGKAEYLEYLKPVQPTVSGRLHELDPRLHGEIALVTGRYRIEGVPRRHGRLLRHPLHGRLEAHPGGLAGARPPRIVARRGVGGRPSRAGARLYEQERAGESLAAVEGGVAVAGSFGATCVSS